MRVVDMQGKPTDAAIHWFGKINGVTRTNIIEEEDKPIGRSTNPISIEVNPFSIETLRIR